VHKCRQALATALELPHLAADPAAPAPTAAGVDAAAATQGTAASTAALTSVPAVAAGGPLAQDNAAAAEPTPPAAAASVSTAAGAADAAAAVAAAGAAAADDAGLPWPVLFHHVMGDCQLVPPDQEVPLTGVGEQLDRRLSAVFIEPFDMQVGLGFKDEWRVWGFWGLRKRSLGLGFIRVSTHGMQGGGRSMDMHGCHSRAAMQESAEASLGVSGC